MTAAGLIGCGGMAQDVAAALRASPGNGVAIVGALARPGRGGEARFARLELPLQHRLRRAQRVLGLGAGIPMDVVEHEQQRRTLR